MSLKEVKQRILSVKNTQKITSAMKLVSAAKLRRAQSAIEGVRPYRQKLDEMLLSYLSAADSVAAPYTRSGELHRVAVVAVSSNSSLCGSFNASVIRLAKEVIDGYSSMPGVAVEVYPVGKKVFDSLQKEGCNINAALMSQAGAPDYSDVATVAHELMNRFLAGEIDKIELVYSHFYSAAKQMPVREVFLPVDLKSMQGGAASAADYIVEPGKEALVKALLPKVITLRLYAALLDSVAAEHAARMLAMQIATDNADDLITELVREYNKSRQQAITNELLDIVSGSSAG